MPPGPRRRGIGNKVSHARAHARVWLLAMGEGGAYNVNEKKYFLTLAKGEMEGAALYEKVAGFVKSESDRETLLAIAREEQSHAKTFASYAGETPSDRTASGWDGMRFSRGRWATRSR